MTKPNELLWNHAIDNEDYDLAEKIAEADTEPATPEDKTSGISKSGITAILDASEYWGLDYGSLPNNTP